ncbi:MAG TPA: hypothetical protein VGH88_15565 [Streptosporangiaceae bacterium]
MVIAQFGGNVLGGAWSPAGPGGTQRPGPERRVRKQPAGGR